jgi:hypothetical protein
MGGPKAGAATRALYISLTDIKKYQPVLITVVRLALTRKRTYSISSLKRRARGRDKYAIAVAYF